MIPLRQPVLRRYAVDLAAIVVAYPAVVVAVVLTAAATGELSRALAVCMLELGGLPILVPWSCSSGKGRVAIPRAILRAVLLVAVSFTLALAFAGGQAGAALVPVFKWQLVAATFAILLAGVWQISAGATGWKSIAQVASSVIGGLMLSSLFWSPVVLDVVGPGVGKNVLVSAVVWCNPLLNATAWAFGADLTVMPHGYRYGVLASYGFLYPPGWLVAALYGACGVALATAGMLLRSATGQQNTEGSVTMGRGSSRGA